MACSAKPRAPWPAPTTSKRSGHAEVRDVIQHDRRSGRAVVREVARPTRANLDFAIHHANPIFAEPKESPERVDTPAVIPAGPFGGVVVATTIVASITQTPLTEEERSAPLSFSPMVEWLARQDYQLAGGLEDARSAIRSESWGQGGGPHLVRQRATEAFLHRGEPEDELWIRIEFAPWFDALTDLPDEDGDSVPEIYGRLRSDLVAPEAIDRIANDYRATVLDRAGLQTWANEVASYWYPSHNTDLETAGSTWPDDATDPKVVATLGGQSFSAPALVMVGRPHGEAIYTVLQIPSLGAATSPQETQTDAVTARSHGPTPDPEPLATVIRAEVDKHGGWQGWAKELAPVREGVQRLLASQPEEIKALVGADGFLFYRASLRQMIAGDFRAQSGEKNPFPALVEFKEMLAGLGVDFLFVPIPTKSAVFPDKVTPAGKPWLGELVNPYERKLLLELAEAGVEVLDVTTPLLAARREGGEPLYLAQDTHWTDRGLQIVAGIIAERVRRYPWFTEVSKQPVAYETRPAPFTHRGDLPGRLAEADQSRYGPVELSGTQVLAPNGEVYDDDPDSPITILGDSFTGVYQRTFCRNAGVSAHVAKNLGVPVDLVMSYGGGPTVRKKLLRRGREALATKRIVIWVMAARDLYDFWGAWDSLE